MFAVIEPVLCRRRFAEPLRRQKPPALRRVPTPCGASFYALRVPYRGVFPWQTVQRAVGALPLVLPDGLHAPENVPLRLFEPKRLPLLCETKTVAQLLRERVSKPSSIGVLDPYGALCGETFCLLSAASDVRIATDVPERFQSDVRTAMREYGAALTVRRERAVLNGCDTLVCECADGVPGAKAVYCLRQDAYRADTVRVSGFTLPDDYARLLPDGINALTFGAALFELCAAYGLSRCRFTALS